MGGIAVLVPSRGRRRRIRKYPPVRRSRNVWKARRRGARSAPVGPGRIHLVQLQDLAGTAAAAHLVHLADVQLLELEAPRFRRGRRPVEAPLKGS